MLDATAIGGVAARLASSNARVSGAARVSHDQNWGEVHATSTAASTRSSRRDAAVRFVRYAEWRQYGTDAGMADAPAPTRQALTALLMRLIFHHAAGDHRPQPRKARHDV